MPDGITINIEGLGKVSKRLEALPKELQRRAIASALSRATTPMLRSAQNNAPFRSAFNTGALRRSIIRVVRKLSSGKVVWIGLGVYSKFRLRYGIISRGPRKGQAAIAEPIKYVHLVESGTVRSEANPFLKGAFLKHRNSVQDLFAKHLDIAVTRAVEKLRRS